MLKYFCLISILFHNQLNYNNLCHESERIFDKWNVNSVNCSVFSVRLNIVYYFTIYIQLKILIINQFNRNKNIIILHYTIPTLFKLLLNIMP